MREILTIRISEDSLIQIFQYEQIGNFKVCIGGMKGSWEIVVDKLEMSGIQQALSLTSEILWKLENIKNEKVLR